MPRVFRGPISSAALILICCVVAGCHHVTSPMGAHGAAASQTQDSPTPGQIPGHDSTVSLAMQSTGAPGQGTAATRGPRRYRLVDVAKQAGLNYRWKIAGRRPIDILQSAGNGCAFLDYNGDGNLDILLVGPKLALYRGDGRGHFTDVTHAMGLDNLRGHFQGCAVGDYDNDGFDDIYISGYRTGLLLHNDGGSHFHDVTKEMGLKPQPWGASCGFADLDGDGYLDLYVANYVDFGPKSPRLCPYEGHEKVLGVCGPLRYHGLKGVLYHNLAGHGFADVTRPWGADRQSGSGLGVAFADDDGDGAVDMVLANDEQRTDTFQNLGKGKLKDVSELNGIGYGLDGDAYAGMGVDWGDYDNDGKMDLFITTFDFQPKCLYHNDGGGLFTNVSENAGFRLESLPFVSFGCKFIDLNNDGYLDLLVASGHVGDNIHAVKKNAYYREPVQFFINRPAPRGYMLANNHALREFANASRKAGLDQLPLIVGRGLAIGDFDNDGRMDALVVDSEGAPLLLHNESTLIGNWGGFRLRGGARMNRDGYGAVITVEAGGQKIMRQCQTCGSYLSSSDPRVHFGLAFATRIDRMTVRWPNGKIDTWTNLPIGRYLNLFPGKHP